MNISIYDFAAQCICSLCQAVVETKNNFCLLSLFFKVRVFTADSVSYIFVFYMDMTIVFKKLAF